MSIQFIQTYLTLDYTLKIVILGSAMLGAVSGILGTFAVLRKQSLLGDMVSHAAFPGIIIAFMLSQTRNILILMLGAAISGIVASFIVMKIINTTRIKMDSALGLTLSVFFGLGLLLFTKIQNSPNVSQAGLEKFLFGQAATILKKDVWMLITLGSAVILVITILWRGFKLITFDRNFAISTGLPVKRLDILITFLITLSIILGLQLVGVILMSAMLIAPATAARQWTEKMWVMVLLSAIFGSISGATGAVISSFAVKVPTGPVVVLIAGLIVVLSILFSPNRGIVWVAISRMVDDKSIRKEMLLQRLLIISQNHSDPFRPHSKELLNFGFKSKRIIKKQFNDLEKSGLISCDGHGLCSLTSKGLEIAKEKKLEGDKS